MFRTSLGLVAASLALALVPVHVLAQAATPAPTAPAKTTCKVDLSSPSDGELALAKRDYATAETFFRAAIKTDPASEDAHLGLVRALIGKNDVSGARTEAETMLMRNPHLPDEGTSPTGLEVSGILGSATLSQLVMEIDYRDNLVHFTFDLLKGFH